MKPSPDEYRKRIRQALEEDRAGADVTTQILALGGDTVVDAEARVDERVVIAGVDIAREVYRVVDEDVDFSPAVADGAQLARGDLVWRVIGSAPSILVAERVALNMVQHLSGIATLTARYVSAASGITILDTRKTTPLWRDLEKYAVRCGGGENHRRDLSAMVLVKENHIRALGGKDRLVDCLLGLRKKDRPFVEVEVDTTEFLETLAQAGLLGNPIDRVMLDNFASTDIPAAIETIGGRAQVEVSGGITVENIAAYAVNGVDFISVGALTHSAPAASLSLEVV